MSKTVTINNVSYPDVPAIQVPLSSGSGYATFTDIDAQSVYSVSKSLTRVTVSNSATKVLGGNSYYAELTPDSGYQISSVTVTMGGIDITDSVFSGGIGEKAITSNGIFEADDDNLLAYSRVSVNVPGGSTLGTKSITSNGTYNASSDSLDGYSSVTVNVSAPSPTLQTKSKSYTPTESQQSETITADTGYDGLSSVAVTVGAISSSYVGSGITRRSSSDLSASGDTVSVPAGYYASSASKAVASGTAGTPTASKGTVSNHSISVTPSVTNTTGYITGSTKTGTAVTVTASELVSGSETKTANGTYDVTNLASLVVNVSGGGSDVVTGTLNVASNVNTSTSTQITTTSAIGFTPTKFFFWKTERTATSNHVHQATFTTLGSYYIRTMTRYSNNSLATSGNANNWTTQTAGYLYFNNNTIYFRSSSSYILSSGTWNWAAIK